MRGLNAPEVAVTWERRELVLHVRYGLIALAQADAEREGCPPGVRPTWQRSNKYRDAIEYTWRWVEPVRMISA